MPSGLAESSGDFSLLRNSLDSSEEKDRTLEERSEFFGRRLQICFAPISKLDRRNDRCGRLLRKAALEARRLERRPRLHLAGWDALGSRSALENCNFAPT